MRTAKEKMSNMSSAGKEHVQIYKAKVEEKAEKARARTKGEKEIAVERRKAKEAQAKMELHAAKADHKAEKINAHHVPLAGGHGHHAPVVGGHGHHVGTHGHHKTGTAAPTTGVRGPGYTGAGHVPGGKYI
ncbi:hypothetical protein GIB67_032458 [Kingdonia uniflora]|uniref:Uncharacterized protein n=1 Tax=Kingdonia uniflora TaxID=39325 RepID=A0A7J7L7M4_9MAGN|nr:hypothetical protein GIB67_032458 [Kingdonia uniflora]